MSLDMVVLRLRERLELLLRPGVAPLPTAGGCRPASTRPGTGIWMPPTTDCWRSGDWRSATASRSVPWSSLGRIPGMVYPLVYLCLAEPEAGAVRGCWHPLADLPGLDLAFDHGQLVAMGLERLRIKEPLQHLTVAPAGGRVHPLGGAARRFEIVLQTPMNTAAFRKPGSTVPDPGGHRPQAHRQAASRHPLPAGEACCVMFDQVMNGRKHEGCLRAQGAGERVFAGSAGALRRPEQGDCAATG